MGDIPRRELLATAAAGVAMPGERRLNVLVLRSDEHNPLYSTPYGHPSVRTPNLERLARLGTTYENCYCASPLCMPSRSAYVSGRHVHEIGAYSNCNALPGDYPTYGKVLAEQGVHTVHIGKTDVYAPADKLGFSEMIQPGDRARPGDTCISRHPLCIRRNAHLRADGWGVPKDRPNPHAYDEGCVEKAIEWLGRNAGTVGKPWTLEVNVGAPHFPHYVTREEWELYAQGGDLPRFGGDLDSARHPVARDLRDHFETDQFCEANVRGLRRGYLGCVTFVDRQLGRLLDAYERLGLARDTLIVYTSDHGEMLGKFGMWWKCSLYEDSARVPLLVAGPGFRAGARVRTPVTQLDLQAALFHATASKRPKGWRGVALQRIRPDDPKRVAFSEYHGHGTRCSSYMVRKGDWKLIYHADAPQQLFDLRSDPNELRNLAETRLDVLRDLTAELRRICDPEEENRRAERTIAAQLAAIRAMGITPGDG